MWASGPARSQSTPRRELVLVGNRGAHHVARIADDRCRTHPGPELVPGHALEQARFVQRLSCRHRARGRSHLLESIGEEAEASILGEPALYAVELAADEASSN